VQFAMLSYRLQQYVTRRFGKLFNFNPRYYYF
jgi:hypothetical protein